MENFTAPFLLNTERDGQKPVTSALGQLIGQTVCVSYTTVKSDDGRFGVREHFEPQISVEAELEGSAETGRFRVLINDSTYSYFYDDSVWSMGQDIGKTAKIFIS
tara:strand:+ start:229 stop:543 length:315 start_codon:yes stop_codon:yes gene_type:complete